MNTVNWQSEKIPAGVLTLQVSRTDAGVMLTVSVGLALAVDAQLTDDATSAVALALQDAVERRNGASE